MSKSVTKVGLELLGQLKIDSCDMSTMIMVITTSIMLTMLTMMLLVSRWLGPVSVAVYAPGDDFKTALDTILHIR